MGTTSATSPSRAKVDTMSARVASTSPTALSAAASVSPAAPCSMSLSPPTLILECRAPEGSALGAAGSASHGAERRMGGRSSRAPRLVELGIAPSGLLPLLASIECLRCDAQACVLRSAQPNVTPQCEPGRCARYLLPPIAIPRIDRETVLILRRARCQCACGMRGVQGGGARLMSERLPVRMPDMVSGRLFLRSCACRRASALACRQGGTARVRVRALARRAAIGQWGVKGVAT